MLKNILRLTALIFAIVLVVEPARAQTPAPSPESLAAAKELVATVNLTNQFNALMPSIMKALKPAVVQGRSDVDRDYDAMVPVLLDGFQARLNELIDAVVLVYASNFTAEELQGLIAFYKTPVGQKLLQKTPGVTQQTMAAGQKFGASVGAEMQAKMIEELRKKGHNL